VWRTVRRDAGAHPSPNSGVAESAFAAALGLRLGGTNRYGTPPRVELRPTLGIGRPPEPADIARAVELSHDVGLLLAAALSAAGLLAPPRRRPRSPRLRPSPARLRPSPARRNRS
jgi:adenosylcobinamide-phosphate synthase